MNKVFNAIGLLLVLLVSSCSGSSESDLFDNPPAQSDHVTPDFHILADEHLSEGHKLAMLAAINEWTDKTNFTIHYTLEFKDMSNEPMDLKTPHTIRVFVKDPGPGLVGWTEWHIDNQSANTLVEPSLADDTFRMVMLHELGHAFDLHFDKDDIHYHGPYQSVMYPSIGDASEHLSCPELTSFCSKYGCQIDCQLKQK